MNSIASSRRLPSMTVYSYISFLLWFKTLLSIPITFISRKAVERLRGPLRNDDGMKRCHEHQANGVAGHKNHLSKKRYCVLFGSRTRDASQWCSILKPILRGWTNWLPYPYLTRSTYACRLSCAEDLVVGRTLT